MGNNNETKSKPKVPTKKAVTTEPEEAKASPEVVAAPPVETTGKVESEPVKEEAKEKTAPKKVAVKKGRLPHVVEASDFRSSRQLSV